jgi:quercetin dioxygenase-like cupin family protein
VSEVISRREQREVLLLDTRPELTVTWSRYAAGERGPDLHLHREHVDAFYVLSGELTFERGAERERVVLRAGEYLAVPPHVPHGFANESGAETTWLNFHAPDAGFATYMRGARDGVQVEWDSFDL